MPAHLSCHAYSMLTKSLCYKITVMCNRNVLAFWLGPDPCNSYSSMTTHLLAFQTALLHLKPLPKPSCHTRSPAEIPLKVSM